MNGTHAEKDVEPESLRSNLFTSSTKTRISELNTLHTQLVAQGNQASAHGDPWCMQLSDLNTTDLSPDAQSLLLRFLTRTYSFYVDRHSRHAVQECLRALLSAPASDAHWTVVVGFLSHEGAKDAIAPGSLFVLVEWCSVLLQEVAAAPRLWPTWGLKIVAAQAQILEKCLSASVRPPRKHAALVSTRRGLRTIAKNTEIQKEAINAALEMLTAKGTSPTAGNAPLLGVIAGVCDRLSSMQSVLREHAIDYYAFYTREVIGSRTKLPAHIADGLHDFFTSSATSTEAFESTITPGLEKALLRAPEIVLDLVAPLVTALPNSVDLSKSLKDSLLKSLLSNTKSTNPEIRNGALHAFRAVISKCADTQILSEAVDEILKSFKDAKAADQRVLLSSMLADVPLSDAVAEKLAVGVSAVASKEANEAALNAESKAVASSAIFSLKHGKSLDATTTKSFVQGLSDKKQSTRKIWALRCGDIAWALDAEELKQPGAVQFFESALEKLANSWDEVIGNPISAAQNGLVAAAYVLVVMNFSKLNTVTSAKITAALKKAAVASNVTGTDAKPLFLVNHRIYSKVTAEDDILWTLRALTAVSGLLPTTSSGSTFSSLWGQAMIFMLTASSIPPNVRHEAGAALSQALMTSPESVSTAMVAGLWDWLRSLDLEEKDAPAIAAKTERERLHNVLQAMCTPKHTNYDEAKPQEPAYLQNVLVKLQVLARSPLIPRSNWIDLCLKSGADPSAIVADQPEAFLEEIILKSSVSLSRRSGCNSSLT